MTRRTEGKQSKPTASVEEVDVEALLREAEAADAAARATVPTPEQERSIIAAAEALAGSEEGVPAKSRAAVLERPQNDCRSRPRAPYRHRTDHSTPRDHRRHIGAALAEPVWLGSNANTDLSQRMLHTHLRGRDRTARNRDAQAAASRDKLLPIGP